MLLLSFNADSQNVVERCFYSIGSGENFDNSADITNSGGCDVGFYNGSAWSGVALGVASPYDCDNPRVIRVPTSEAAGFRLTNGLTAGANFNLQVRVLNTGGELNFGVYTSNSGQFANEDGIQATFVGNQNVLGTNWQDLTIGFNIPADAGGHNWIFLSPQSGTGFIANFCQNGLTKPTVDLGADIELCQGESFDFDITNPSSSYTWSTGSVGPTLTIGFETTLTGEASNSCGAASDEVEVVVYSEPALNVTTDTIICLGESLLLEAPGWNASYLWSDGSTGETLLIDTAGVYSVQVIDNCFTITDQLELSYLSPPEVDLGPDTAVCNGTVDYYVASGGSTSIYSWNTGGAGPGIVIIETGEYNVDITNICGSASDAVFVEFSYSPGDFLPDSIEFCEGRPMVLDLSGIEGSFEWSDGGADDIYDVPNPGWHFVKITDDDSCFVAHDTIYVDRIFCDCPVHIANAFTPNGDGFNEEYSIVFECPPYDYELTIFDRWGQQIFNTTDPNKKWSGRNRYGDIFPSAVYSYVLKYTEEYQGFLKVRTGSVALLKD
ncbi:MAG: gliding motility-associated C-terminal domain-containing protein [Flavobacteriales bacterium]